MNFKTIDQGPIPSPPGGRDIRSIITLLATQCLIHLGEIPDPLTQATKINEEKARFFLGLLQVIKEKTKGNLDARESGFLADILENIEKIILQRTNGGK